MQASKLSVQTSASTCQGLKACDGACAVLSRSPQAVAKCTATLTVSADTCIQIIILHSRVIPMSIWSCICSAVKAGRFPQAVAQYTAALAACAEAGSPAFAAVLHSNRAAALQSQHLHAEAMADCLRSRSLDPSFTKVRKPSPCQACAR